MDQVLRQYEWGMNYLGGWLCLLDTKWAMVSLGTLKYFFFCVCGGGKLQAYFYVYYDSISLNIDHAITTIFHNAMVWYHGYS